MSYILDALRKSEQERQRGKVPDIHGAVSETSQPAKKINIWPIVTVVVIAVNLGVVGYFWSNMNSGASPNQPPSNTAAVSASTPSSTPEPAPAAVPPAQTTANSQPLPTPASKPAPKPQPSSTPEYVPPNRMESQTATAANTVDDSQPPPNVGYLPQLEELPAYERDGIPDMTFSSHMYSSIPRFRSIIINGKRLKEGQYFNGELQVREITEGGVIMSRGNTLFEVDVLGRWAQ